jgi:hypothetical protein
MLQITKLTKFVTFNILFIILTVNNSVFICYRNSVISSFTTSTRADFITAQTPPILPQCQNSVSVSLSFSRSLCIRIEFVPLFMSKIILDSILIPKINHFTIPSSRPCFLVGLHLSHRCPMIVEAAKAVQLNQRKLECDGPRLRGISFFSYFHFPYPAPYSSSRLSSRQT